MPNYSAHDLSNIVDYLLINPSYSPPADLSEGEKRQLYNTINRQRDAHKSDGTPPLSDEVVTSALNKLTKQVGGRKSRKSRRSRRNKHRSRRYR